MVITSLESRVCKDCRRPKPLDAFSLHTPKTGNKFRDSYCKPCAVKRQKARKLKCEYGLSMEQFEEMKRAQNYRCKICGVLNPEFNVDHDHRTDRVRGLLCQPCNTGIGLLKDDPLLLKAALIYLEQN